MEAQNRFYLLLLNDPRGTHPHGPYTKSQARIAQIANTGSRIITAAQLATMRAHGEPKGDSAGKRNQRTL
jgi:hypothetical protein